MSTQQHLDVAVLLATYNGERYVEQQIKSLSHNNTSFTLHWIDDHSVDRTRQIVRSVSRSAGITLKEWHHSQHQGYPGAFFHLLECVEAHLYLFCDQDDIWQAGKIDATVENLLPDLGSPVICFSDPLTFKHDQPERHYRLLELFGSRPEVALQESRTFMCLVGNGNTEGFTRPLREIYMRHKDIARAYAPAHDVWMYLTAVASGSARLLTEAPTVLYRWHETNVSGDYMRWKGAGTGRIIMTWRQHQRFRRNVSRIAAGFILAAPTLPQSPKVERLLAIARLVAVIHRRQSPTGLIRLIRCGAMWPSPRFAFGLAAACLCSHA